MQLANQEICNRRLFPNAARVARDGKENVSIDDHGLVLDEDAIGMRMVCGEDRDFDPVGDERLAVRLMLCSSGVDVRRP